MKSLGLKLSALIGKSPLRRLAGDAIIAVITSTGVKGIAFFKEILVASYFGLSDGIDVYLMAFVLIGFPLSLFINAVQGILITYLASGTEGTENRDKWSVFTSSIILILLLLLVLLPFWLLIINYAMPWLASGFSVEKQQLLQQAIYYLIPYYFFNGFSLLAYGALQAKRNFVLNGLLPGATAMMTIILMVFFGGAFGWKILIASLVMGTFVESIILYGILWRRRLLTLSSKIFNPGVKQIAKDSLSLIPGTFFTAMAPLISQAVAASLGQGTNAALGYGYRLPTALNGIMVIAVSITVLPFFSSLLADKKIAYCIHSMKKLSFLLIVFGILMAAVLFFYSEQIIVLFFQRGAFDISAVARVSPLQQIFFFETPFAMVSMVNMRLLIALGKGRALSFATGGAVGIQICLIFFLGRMLGAEGIAWATTLAMIISSLLYFVLARFFLQKELL